jgi:hypothetical protein
MSRLSPSDRETLAAAQGQPFTVYDYLVLRAAQRQYWLWLALSHPEHWEEDPRHYVLARVRVAYGLDAGEER